MQVPVAREEIGPLGPHQLAEGVVQSLRRQPRVEPRQRVTQPLLQHDLVVVDALAARLARDHVGAVLDGPAGGLKPLEGGFFDYRFGERHGHFTHSSTGLSRNCSTEIASPPTRSMPLRLERIRERSHPRKRLAHPAALDLDGSHRASGLHHEIDLAATLTPVEELANSANVGIGEMGTDGRLHQPAPELRVGARLRRRQTRLRRHAARC